MQVPRNARKLSKTGIYHIMLRGNEKRDIFEDDADKLAFINFLYNKKVDEGCLVYAYCLMDNHVHLVVKEGVNGLAKFMRRIGTSYAKYYNQRYNRSGHLFQDRFQVVRQKDSRDDGNKSGNYPQGAFAVSVKSA